MSNEHHLFVAKFSDTSDAPSAIYRAKDFDLYCVINDVADVWNMSAEERGKTIEGRTGWFLGNNFKKLVIAVPKNLIPLDFLQKNGIDTETSAKMPDMIDAEAVPSLPKGLKSIGHGIYVPNPGA